MKDNRPVHLNLMKIKMPITAITSILHRISGVFLFLVIPLLLWCLQYSLASPMHFLYLQASMTQTWFKGLVLLTVWALLYHLLAGIKHLFMDIGWFETKTGGRIASIVVLVLFALLALFSGALIW